MDFNFWASFLAALLLPILLAKYIFAYAKEPRSLAECVDPARQYWRFYFLRLANLRCLLSLALGISSPHSAYLTYLHP